MNFEHFCKNYVEVVEELTMNEFRRQVGEYINQTYYANKSFVLMKGQKKVAAIVPLAILDRLTELEAYYTQTIVDRQQSEQAAIGRDEINKEAIGD